MTTQRQTLLSAAATHFRSMPFAAISEHDADRLAAEIGSGDLDSAIIAISDDMGIHHACGNMKKYYIEEAICTLLFRLRNEGGE